MHATCVQHACKGSAIHFTCMVVTQLLCTVLCDLSIEYWGAILNLMGFLCFDTMAARLQLCMNLIAENYCNYILLPYSYSLYEPKSHALMEYNGGLEKAILRDSELLNEVNDAFCKSHPLLAQKVVTRSAHAAVRLVQMH